MSEDRLTITEDKDSCRSVQVHKGWKGGKLADLVGRVGDLRAAYKQLPIHAESRKYCVISSVNPATGKAELFIPSALMFGQTAAVYAFLRFSRAISTLSSKLLYLTMVEFFDDFTQLQPKASAQPARGYWGSWSGRSPWRPRSESLSRKGSCP